MILRVLALLLLMASPAFAFPTTPVLDTAIRADENPLGNGNWTGPIRPGQGQLQILSNGITGVTDANNHSSYWSASSFGPGSEVYATLKTVPVGDFQFFLYLRMNNPNTSSVTGYAVQIANFAGVGTYSYRRSDTGPLLQLTADLPGPTLVAGDKVGAQMVGNQLILFIKQGAGAWTAFDGGVTDTTYPSGGYIGARISDATLAIESFGGGLSGFTDTTPPTTPTGLVASAITSSSISLSWIASTDDNGSPTYRIERAPFSGSCGAYTEIISQPTTTYTDTGRAAATTYCHRVRAFDGVNFSAYSPVTTTMTLAYRTAVIDWNDNSPNAQNAVPETGFQLESCAGPGCGIFTVLATLGSNVTHYVDTTSPAPVGGYRVTALPFGSGYSNIIYTTPSTPPAVLAVTPPTFSFMGTVGAANPATQSLTISNGGGTGMTWTVTDNASWLSVAPAGGTDNAILVVTVNQAGLVAGTYNATITVTAAGANGSPAAIPVTFILAPDTQSTGSTPGSGSSGRIR